MREAHGEWELHRLILTYFDYVYQVMILSYDICSLQHSVMLNFFMFAQDDTLVLITNVDNLEISFATLLVRDGCCYPKL